MRYNFPVGHSGLPSLSLVTHRLVVRSLDITTLEPCVAAPLSPPTDFTQPTSDSDVEFDSFGKLGIVQHKLSPDAFVQLAMMAAYYALFGKVVIGAVAILAVGLVLRGARE